MKLERLNIIEPVYHPTLNIEPAFECIYKFFLMSTAARPRHYTKREQNLLSRVIPPSGMTLEVLANAKAHYVNLQGHAAKVLRTDIPRMEHLYSIIRDPKMRPANVVPGPSDGGTILCLAHDPVNTFKAYEEFLSREPTTFEESVFLLFFLLVELICWCAQPLLAITGCVRGDNSR